MHKIKLLTAVALSLSLPAFAVGCSLDPDEGEESAEDTQNVSESKKGDFLADCKADTDCRTAAPHNLRCRNLVGVLVGRTKACLKKGEVGDDCSTDDIPEYSYSYPCADGLTCRPVKGQENKLKCQLPGKEGEACYFGPGRPATSVLPCEREFEGALRCETAPSSLIWRCVKPELPRGRRSSSGGDSTG